MGKGSEIAFFVDSSCFNDSAVLFNISASLLSNLLVLYDVSVLASTKEWLLFFDDRVDILLTLIVLSSCINLLPDILDETFVVIFEGFKVEFFDLFIDDLLLSSDLIVVFDNDKPSLVEVRLIERLYLFARFLGDSIFSNDSMVFDVMLSLDEAKLVEHLDDIDLLD